MDLRFVILILIVGFFAGLSEGASGAGWGVFTLALLVALGVKPGVAVSSSIFVELILGILNNLLHFEAGHFDIKLVIPLISAGIVGMILGAKYADKIPEIQFKLLTGIIVLLFGCIIIGKVLLNR